MKIPDEVIKDYSDCLMYVMKKVPGCSQQQASGIIAQVAFTEKFAGTAVIRHICEYLDKVYDDEESD